MNDQHTILEQCHEDNEEVLKSRIADMENALEEVAEIWNARYEVAQGRIAELEQALMDVKHLTDPIIERARRALERGNPSSGLERAKGVLPWKEGDELPEDAIRRLRDNEP